MKKDRHTTRRLATVTSLEARRRQRETKEAGRPAPGGLLEQVRPAEVLVPDYVEGTRSRQFGQVLLFLVQERPGGKLSWRALMLDFLAGTILDAPQLDGLEEKDLREMQRAALLGLGGLDPAWGDGVPLVRLSWPEAQALMWEAWAISAISGDESEDDFATRRLLRRWGVKAELPGPLADGELTAVTRKLVGGLGSPEGLMEVFRNAWAAGDWGLYYDLFQNPEQAFVSPDVSGRTDFIIDRIEEDILSLGFDDEEEAEGEETLHVLDVRRLPGGDGGEGASGVDTGGEDTGGGDAESRAKAASRVESSSRAVAWVAYVRGDEVDEWQEQVDRLELGLAAEGTWLVAALDEGAWPGPVLASDTPFAVAADFALDRLAAYAFSRFDDEVDRAEREYFQSSAIYELEDFPGYSFFIDHFLFEWQVTGMWGTVVQAFAEEEELAPRWRQAFRRLLTSRKSFFEVISNTPAGGGTTLTTAVSAEGPMPGAGVDGDSGVDGVDGIDGIDSVGGDTGISLSFDLPFFADTALPILALNAQRFVVRDLLDPTSEPFEVRALGDRRLLPAGPGEVVTGRVVDWLGQKYFTPAIMVVPSTMGDGVKNSLAAIFTGQTQPPAPTAMPPGALPSEEAGTPALSRRRAERLAGSFERVMFLPALLSLAESGLEIPEVRPRRRAALLEEAELLVADGFSVDAGLYLKQIQARYPEDQRALVAMGEVEKNLGRADDARAIFEGLLARNEANLEAACGLAELNLATGRSDDARQVLEKALSAARAHPLPVPVSDRDREARTTLRATLIMAMAEAAAQNRHQAERWAASAGRMLTGAGLIPSGPAGPAGPPGLSGLAGREKVEAQTIDLAFQAAVFLLDQRAYRAAAGILETLSQADTAPATASQVLGVAYMRMGRPGKAARSYMAAAGKDPDNYVIWLGLADSRLALGHLKLAEEAYVRCLSLAPGQVSALNNLGVTLLKRGQFFAAAELFRQVVEIAPDHVNANINLAVLLENEGRIEEAQRCVYRVLAVDPQNSAALEMAARLRRRAARPATAATAAAGGAGRGKGGRRKSAAAKPAAAPKPRARRKDDARKKQGDRER